MSDRWLSRRRLLGLGGGALAAFLLGRGFSQVEARRVGVVLPAARDEFRLDPESVEIAANAARRGAILAEEAAGRNEMNSLLPEVLYATAPDSTTAMRAAERLVIRDEVFALVGGIGEGHAEALARVAADHGILFFNVGSASDSLRRGIRSRNSFHVEASAEAYLTALAEWFWERGARHWFLVHAGTEDGRALKERASLALNKVGGVSARVTGFEVPDSPIYREALATIRFEEPDLVVMLLDWRAQLEFLGQYEAAELSHELTGFPVPVAQTRQFFRAARSSAPSTGTGPRIVLWDAALEGDGAAELSRSFFARWGLPMDPAGWAAYQAIAILFEAVADTGSTDRRRLIGHFEGADTTFEIAKGRRAAFGENDHQLRQPLYMVEVDATSEDISELGVVVAELPDPLPPG